MRNRDMFRERKRESKRDRESASTRRERENRFNSHTVPVSDIFIAFCSYLSNTTATMMMMTKTTAINKKAAQNYPSRCFSGTIPLDNCFIFRVLSSIYSFVSCRRLFFFRFYLATLMCLTKLLLIRRIIRKTAKYIK